MQNIKFDLKIHKFRILFIMPECAKTHLQQSAISKIFRGSNPRTPAPKGRPRITRQGRERLTRGGGKGRGGGREEMENNYYCFFWLMLAGMLKLSSLFTKRKYYLRAPTLSKFLPKVSFHKYMFSSVSNYASCPRNSAALQICACLLTLARWLM